MPFQCSSFRYSDYITATLKYLFRRLSPGINLTKTWYSPGVMDINIYSNMVENMGERYGGQLNFDVTIWLHEFFPVSFLFVLEGGVHVSIITENNMIGLRPNLQDKSDMIQGRECYRLPSGYRNIFCFLHLFVYFIFIYLLFYWWWGYACLLVILRKKTINGFDDCCYSYWS